MLPISPPAAVCATWDLTLSISRGSMGFATTHLEVEEITCYCRNKLSPPMSSLKSTSRKTLAQVPLYFSKARISSCTSVWVLLHEELALSKLSFFFRQCLWKQPVQKAASPEDCSAAEAAFPCKCKEIPFLTIPFVCPTQLISMYELIQKPPRGTSYLSGHEIREQAWKWWA